MQFWSLKICQNWFHVKSDSSDSTKIQGFGSQFTSLITPSKRGKKIWCEWHDILIFSAFIFENCCQVFFQTFSARLWNGYHKSRPVNHSMSRLVPKHFDEKNMEKEEENTTHDFLILMIIILMMIMTTIINALLLVDVCKIRKIRKT